METYISDWGGALLGEIRGEDIDDVSLSNYYLLLYLILGGMARNIDYKYP